MSSIFDRQSTEDDSVDVSTGADGVINTATPVSALDRMFQEASAFNQQLSPDPQQFGSFVPGSITEQQEAQQGSFGASVKQAWNQGIVGYAMGAQEMTQAEEDKLDAEANSYASQHGVLSFVGQMAGGLASDLPIDIGLAITGAPLGNILVKATKAAGMIKSSNRIRSSIIGVQKAFRGKGSFPSDMLKRASYEGTIGVTAAAISEGLQGIGGKELDPEFVLDRMLIEGSASILFAEVFRGFGKVGSAMFKQNVKKMTADTNADLGAKVVNEEMVEDFVIEAIKRKKGLTLEEATQLTVGNKPDKPDRPSPREVREGLDGIAAKEEARTQTLAEIGDLAARMSGRENIADADVARIHNVQAGVPDKFATADSLSNLKQQIQDDIDTEFKDLTELTEDDIDNLQFIVEKYIDDPEQVKSVVKDIEEARVRNEGEDSMRAAVEVITEATVRAGDEAKLKSDESTFARLSGQQHFRAEQKKIKDTFTDPAVKKEIDNFDKKRTKNGLIKMFDIFLRNESAALKKHLADIIERRANAAGLTIEQWMNIKKLSFKTADEAFTVFKDAASVIHAPIRATDFADMVHEIGHVIRADLSPTHLKALEKQYGIVDGKWQRHHEEKFAEDFASWLKTSSVQGPRGIKRAFKAVKDWLTNVYKGVLGRGDVNPEIQEVFDDLFRLGGDDVPTVRGEELVSAQRAEAGTIRLDSPNNARPLDPEFDVEIKNDQSAGQDILDETTELAGNKDTGFLLGDGASTSKFNQLLSKLRDKAGTFLTTNNKHAYHMLDEMGPLGQRINKLFDHGYNEFGRLSTTYNEIINSHGVSAKERLALGDKSTVKLITNNGLKDFTLTGLERISITLNAMAGRDKFGKLRKNSPIASFIEKPNKDVEEVIGMRIGGKEISFNINDLDGEVIKGIKIGKDKVTIKKINSDGKGVDGLEINGKKILFGKIKNGSQKIGDIDLGSNKISVRQIDNGLKDLGGVEIGGEKVFFSNQGLLDIQSGSLLSKNEMKIVEATFKANRYMRDEGNKISKRLFGKDIFDAGDEYYIPKHTTLNNVEDVSFNYYDLLGQKGGAPDEAKSIFHSREGIPTIRLTNPFASATRYMNDASSALGYADYIKSYEGALKAGKDDIVNGYGDSWHKTMNSYLDVYKSNKSPNESAGEIVNTLMNFRTTALLGANIGVSLKQHGSVWSAAATGHLNSRPAKVLLDAERLLVNATERKDLMDEAQSLVPGLKARQMQSFGNQDLDNFNSGVSMLGAFGDDISLKEKFDGMKDGQVKGTEVYRDLVNKGMVGIRLFDESTIAAIWKDVRGDLDANGNIVDEATAITKMTKILIESQPTSDKFTRTINQLDMSLKGRIFTQFSSQIAKNAGMMNKSISKFANSKKSADDWKEFGSVMIPMATQTAYIVSAGLLAKEFSDELLVKPLESDKQARLRKRMERRGEKLHEEILTNIIRTSFGQIPVTGSTISGFINAAKGTGDFGLGVPLFEEAHRISAGVKDREWGKVADQASRMFIPKMPREQIKAGLTNL